MRRTRVVSLCATTVAAALIALYLTLWAQVTPLRERGTDFSASYVAATLLRDGHGDRLYDQALEARAHQAMLPAGAHADLPFITPPATAVLALPFTLFDPGTAFRLWSLLQLLLLAAAVTVASRAAPWPGGCAPPARRAIVLLAVAGIGTMAFLLLGQLDGFNALGLAAAYASLRRGHSARAGFWLALGFAIAKPHLAAGLAVWLLARRDWRALAGATGGTAIAVGVSLLAGGPAGLGGFVGALMLSYGHTPPASTIGTAGLAASWLGGGGAATGLAVAGACVALAGSGVLGWRSRHDPSTLEVSLAGATALSLVVSPHLLTHDLVILAPVFAWMGARAATADRDAGWPARWSARLLAGWALLNVCALLDTGNSAPAPPGRLIPWGLLAIGAAAAVALRRRRTGAYARLPAPA